jgi:hypothetical protein
MKKLVASLLIAGTLCACLVAESFGADGPVSNNWAVKDVVRMSEAGISAEVLEAYVQTPKTGYHLQVDDLLYMQQHNVPASVISTMLRHGPKPVEPVRVSNVPTFEPEPAQAPGQPVDYVAPPLVDFPAPEYSPSVGASVATGLGIGIALGLPWLPHLLCHGGHGHHHGWHH